MKIHQIHGKNSYCGPSAISPITGYSSDDAATVLRSLNGRRAIKGASQWDVRCALHAFGVDSTEIYNAPRGKGITLAQWLKQSVEDRKAGVVFLIVAGWHYQVVCGRKATCGRIREIVSVRDKSLKRRSRVSQVYRLSMRGNRIQKPSALKQRDEARKQRTVDPERAAYSKARRLAKQHDFTIDIDSGGYDAPTHYWVFADDATEARADYPWEGDHICCDWCDVLRRIEDIIEFKKNTCDRRIEL